MSLLSISRLICAEIGWPVPATVADNSDATAQQIKGLASGELEALSEKYDWPQLETEYEFNTVIDQSIYAWPDDFRKIAVGSLFDASEYYQVKGSIPQEQWNLRKHGLLGSISCRRFRVRYVGGIPGIEITPTPDSVNALVATYYTNEYAMTEAGTPKATYELDTDVSRIPERLVRLGLKWRFRRAKGLDFSAELAEYNAAIGMIFGAHVASGDIMVGGSRYTHDDLPGGYIPENGFG